jgi:dihydroorotase
MGGFTAVCAMPNTHPPNDNSRITRYILKKAAQANFARVYPVGAISEGLEGKRPCEFGELKAGGAIAVSDEGNPVMDDELMRKALLAAKSHDLPVSACSGSHCACQYG